MTSKLIIRHGWFIDVIYSPDDCCWYAEVIGDRGQCVFETPTFLGRQGAICSAEAYTSSHEPPEYRNGPMKRLKI